MRTKIVALYTRILAMAFIYNHPSLVCESGDDSGACADLENFARGGQTLATFIFYFFFKLMRDGWI